MKNKIIILLVSLFVSVNLISPTFAEETAPGGLSITSEKYDKAIELVMDAVVWADWGKDYYSKEDFLKHKSDYIREASNQAEVPYPDFYEYITDKFRKAEASGTTKNLNEIETKHYIDLKNRGLSYISALKNQSGDPNFKPSSNIKKKEDKSNEIVNDSQIKLNKENSQWIIFTGVFVIVILILFLKYIKDNFLGI